jgi:hypothetical protein
MELKTSGVLLNYVLLSLEVYHVKTSITILKNVSFVTTRSMIWWKYYKLNWMVC